MKEFKNNSSIIYFVIIMYILSYGSFFFIYWLIGENLKRELFIILNIGLALSAIYYASKYISKIIINQNVLVIKKLFSEEILFINELTIHKVSKITRARIKYDELKITAENPYREFVLSSTSWKGLSIIEELIKEFHEQ